MNCNNSNNLVGGNEIAFQPFYYKINNVCMTICLIRNCLECVVTSLIPMTCKACTFGYVLKYLTLEMLLDKVGSANL